MIGENNTTYLYVGNVTNGYANADSVDFNTMPRESVVIVKAEQDSSGGSEAEEDALVSGQKYFVVAKTKSGEIRKSPMFKTSDIVREGIKNYSQPVQQVSFLGYDGSTINGLGSFTEENEYLIRLNLRHTQNTLNNTPEIKHIGYYATDTTTATAAKNFMESFLRNFSPTREPYPTILCDRIAKTTSVGALGGSGTVAMVTKGSKTVKAYIKAVAADTTLTVDDFSVTADDVINLPSYNGRTFTFDCLDAVSHAAYIGTESYFIADAATAADGSDNATALAAAINAGSTICTASASTATVTITMNEGATALPPMVFSDVDGTPARVAVAIATGDDVAVKYVAAATVSEAATFELDEPWQGPTGYIHDHTVEATSIGDTTLDGDNWGLKFTGLYNSNFNPVTDTPDIIEFDVLAGDLEGVTEYKDVAPYRGSGSWRDVAALENYAQGMDRFYMADDMITRREFTAAEGYNYDIISLSLSQSPYTSSATGQRLENPFTINIALANSIADYDEIDAVFGLD